MLPAPAPSGSAAGALLRGPARALRAGRQQAGAARQQAAGGVRAGSGGNGGSRKRGAGAKLERTNITFRVPGEGAHTFERIRQDGLNEYMRLFRAKGFRTAGGRLSRYLEDLPEGGTVDLALLEWLSVEKQAVNTQQPLDNDDAATPQHVCAFMQQHAAREHPGSTITVLPTEPFKDRNQQDFVQLGVAVVAGHMLYLAEHQCVLREDALVDLLRKVAKIRRARTDGSSPALAAALQGVTHAQLFLAGEGVWEGLAVQDLVDEAALLDVSVVLPSGEAMGEVGAAPPVRL